MVFIVKIPSRSRRGSPEGERGEGGVDKRDEVESSSSSSLHRENGNTSTNSTGADPIHQEQENISGWKNDEPIDCISPSQLGRTTSVQEALDALNMLRIGTNQASSPLASTEESSSLERSDKDQGAEGGTSTILPAMDPRSSSSIHEGISSQEGNSSTSSASAEEASTESSAKSVTPATPSSPPLLDIIVAPAVLAHRYVRGRDVSLIVERPERIRAVLLGVSALLARMTESDQMIYSSSSSQKATSGDDTMAAADDDDDLVAQLQGMSVASGSVDKEQRRQKQIQVLHSTKSIPLNPAHPALAAVHAHQEEMVEEVLPECEERRRRRIKSNNEILSDRDAKDTQTDTSSTLYSSYLAQLCAYAPHSAPVPIPPTPRARQAISATATPTGLGRTRSSARNMSPGTGTGTGTGTASSTPVQLRTMETIASLPSSRSETMIKQEDRNAAPVTPIEEKDPLSLLVPPPATPQVHESSQVKVEIRSSSSSDEEQEGDRHPSEIPHHLSQGDLYLRGSKSRHLTAELSGYGSAEAIKHALGASIEAVDRVCAAAGGHGKTSSSSSTTTGSISPLDLSGDRNEFASSSSFTSGLPSSRRAFVLTRPPGHHCSGSSPSGFCWVNNAAVAALHAYQSQGIDRVVIFDIDLHHGNGTQKIAWRINEETRRYDLERAARIKAALSSVGSGRSGGGAGGGRGRGARKSGGGNTSAASLADVEAGIPPRGLQIFYGSLHDIESFPCEDGDVDLVRDASVCLQGAHGQWICNVHLDTYDSPASFDDLYRTKYSQLFTRARSFLAASSGTPDKTLFLISCGFDACSYELPGMQRHGKHVPPGFYERFARDTVELSEELGQGKVISLLEGGYGDRALCSASIAHLRGLAFKGKVGMSAGGPTTPAASSSHRHYSSLSSALDPYSHEWFSLESLKALEKSMTMVLRNRSAAERNSITGVGRIGGRVGSTGLSTPGVSPTKRRGGGGGGSSSSSSSSLFGATSEGDGNGGDWLRRAAMYFCAFEELCAPLMKVGTPNVKSGW